MGEHVASEVIKLLVKADKKVKGAKILVLGITFKENCPDVRNTKVVDVITQLQEFGTEVTIYDPWANPEEVKHEYNLETTQELPQGPFDAIVLTEAHKEFEELKIDQLKLENAIVYDVKNCLKREVKDSGL